MFGSAAGETDGWSGTLVMVLAIVGLVAGALVAMLFLYRHPAGATIEPEKIELVDQPRRRELIRGSSMHFRDMKYRYSVRADHEDQSAFTCTIEGIVLGFIPVILTDVETDRQGFGYLACIHDGHRWKAPGLPCPGDPEEAISHAGRCLSS